MSIGAALTEEIDRIAQGTNFNGINLLDGSMGLNKSAFTVGDVGGEAATGGTAVDLTGKYGNVDGSATGHVGTADVAEVKPSFEVDLADLEITTSGADNIFTLSIGGTAMQATTALAGAADTTVGAAAIATAIANANNTGFTYGGVDYTVAADGTKLTFTADPDTAVTAGMQSPSGAVTYAIGGTAGSTTTGSIHHATINVTNPVVAVQGTRAGIDLEIDNTIVTDGGKLTIDDKTFVFKTNANSRVTAGAGETLIDVSGFAADDQVQQAVDLLSQQETANFQIEAKDAAHIHIGQKTDSSKVYDTAAKLQGVFSAVTASTSAGTRVTIADNGAIVKGNGLTVGEKTYVFGEDVAIGGDAAATLANFKAALENDGFKAEISGNDIIIRGGNGEEAPYIPIPKGRGFTAHPDKSTLYKCRSHFILPKGWG